MRVPTWLRWLAAGVLIGAALALLGVLVWVLAGPERRTDAGNIAGAGGGLLGALALLERVGGPLWFRYRREVRETRIDHRAVLRERDELNDKIAELEREGPHPDGSARQRRLTDRIDHRDYLDSLLLQEQVLEQAPKGALAAEPSPDRALSEEALAERRRLLDESRRATDVLGADGWFLRGNAAYEAKRYDEALAAYDRAIELRPDYAEAHSNRGVALGRLDRDEQALADYDRAIELRPDYAEAHSDRGVALGALGRQEQALAAYDHAIELRPDLSEAHSNRGVALGKLGRPEAALAACDRAIELRPDYANAHYNRVCALLRVGNFEQALTTLERAFELGIDDDWDLVGSDDDLNPLRDHPEHGPRLRDLIERYRDGDASP